MDESQTIEPGLYIVATPIGNLRDITLRALDVLRAADLIVCEDTRHSSRLLGHYEISRPRISCHSHNEAAAIPRVLKELEKSAIVAYISDAGTPGISDPGGRLASEAASAGFAVRPIPGPSALTAVMSVAGLKGKGITFAGFLSPKGGRRVRQLEELANTSNLVVIYESPHRILRLVADIITVDQDAEIVLGREITKIHEEFVRGKAKELLPMLAARDTIKGEIALIVRFMKAAADPKELNFSGEEDDI